MGVGLSPITDIIPFSSKCCQLVVRRQEPPLEPLRFILEGLEVGQQVIAMASAGWLTSLAHALGENRIPLQSLLRSGRLVFLTAPECLSQFTRPDGPLRASAFRRPAPMVRWLSDWSWAYSNGRAPSTLLDYQHRVHTTIRSLDALSLCTVDSSTLERRALLAVLADHRQAVKGHAPAPQSIVATPSLPQ
jgi:MEDS: MEthanogen/methylotroph, DcmR Sensory domain